MPIRLLLVDDHPIVHQGLVTLFDETDVEIAGHAQCVRQAIELIRQKLPQVVLLDVQLPDMDGLQALEHIRHEYPDVAVVMYSMHENPTYIARSAALGAADYLLKQDDCQKIVTAIQRAARRQEPPSDSRMVKIKHLMYRRRNLHIDPQILTEREIQVLRHVALGLSNKEIGESLGISLDTVKEHVQNIIRKLNLRDRTQAAVWGVKQGIV